MMNPTVRKGRCRSHRPSSEKIAQRRRQAAYSARYRRHKADAAEAAALAAEAAAEGADRRAERDRLDAIEKAARAATRDAHATVDGREPGTPRTCAAPECGQPTNRKAQGGWRRYCGVHRSRQGAFAPWGVIR